MVDEVRQFAVASGVDDVVMVDTEEVAACWPPRSSASSCPSSAAAPPSPRTQSLSCTQQWPPLQTVPTLQKKKKKVALTNLGYLSYSFTTKQCAYN